MKISQKKEEKILEHILAYLYSINPKPIFTSKIAEEIARDEEYIKKLLLNLKKKNLVKEIKMNPKGIPYTRRSRWKLTEKTFHIYNSKQNMF